MNHLEFAKARRTRRVAIFAWVIAIIPLLFFALGSTDLRGPSSQAIAHAQSVLEKNTDQVLAPTLEQDVESRQQRNQNSGVSGKLFVANIKRKSSESCALVDALPPFTMRDADALDCKLWGVVTTIHGPTMALRLAARVPDLCLVIVADRKTPTAENGSYGIVADGCRVVKYLSVEKQMSLKRDGLRFVTEIPWNHFGRKNLGYIYAIMHGAEQVFDFDDDNEIISWPFVNSTVWDTVHGVSNYNPYPDFTDKFIWPRGFPMPDVLRTSSASNGIKVKMNLSVTSWPDIHLGAVQSLANNDPDVDAIFRLTRSLPFDFDVGKNVALLPGSMAPFNAQATMWLELWTLYLPMSIHGRVSDIWRSYMAQRLFWDVDAILGFVSPRVVQHRNSHEYVGDLESEIPLYLKAHELADFLLNWTSSASSMEGRLCELAVAMYERDFFEEEDVRGIVSWISALRQIGFRFPRPASALLPLASPSHDAKKMVFDPVNFSESYSPSHTEAFYVGVNRFGGYNNQLLTYLHHMKTALRLNRTMVVPWIYAIGAHNHEDIGFDAIWQQPQLTGGLRVVPSSERLTRICPRLAVCNGVNLTSIESNYVKKFYGVAPIKVAGDCASEKCIVSVKQSEAYGFLPISHPPKRNFLCPTAKSTPSFRLVSSLDSLRVEIIFLLRNFLVIGAHIRRGYWHFGWQPWEETPNGCWPSFLDMVRTVASECKYLSSISDDANNKSCVVFTASDAPFDVFPSIRTVQLKTLFLDLHGLGVLTVDNFEQARGVAERVANLTGIQYSALEQSLMASFPAFIGNPCSSWSSMVAVQRVKQNLTLNSWRDFTVRESTWTNMSSCSIGEYWQESQVRADAIRASLHKSLITSIDGIDGLVSRNNQFDWNSYQEERRSAQYRYKQNGNQMSR